MASGDRPLYRAIFILVLAPIAAAVTITTLLLFGAKPYVVFYAGHAVKSLLNTLGFPAPNWVGVLTTMFVWWLLIVAVGLAWERRRGRRRSA